MNNLCNKIHQLKLLSGPFSTGSSKCGQWGTVSTRNTFILKRRVQLRLAPKNQPPTAYRPLRSKDYEYELVEFIDGKKRPDVEVVLRKFVDGLGEAGEVVKVKRHTAYNKLLLTGLAEYATPEAIAQAERKKKESRETEASSRFAPMVS